VQVAVLLLLGHHGAREGEQLCIKSGAAEIGNLYALAISRRRRAPSSPHAHLQSTFLCSAFLLLPAPLQSIPCNRSVHHHVFSPFSTPLPEPEPAGPGASRSGMNRAGARREDSGRQNPPPRPCREGVLPLQLVRYVRVGTTDLLLLPPALEEFGLQLQHLTPHSVLLVAVFAHFMEMFVGVRPCTAIFRHFYALVGTGRSKREVGAYYFELRHGMANSYISAFSSAKWEDWRDGWVIAEANPNDRLELPTERLQSDRST
jgi:hypothetical protein